MIARAGNIDIQLGLFLDYANNIRLYHPFPNISGKRSHRCSLFGVNTILSLSPQVRRLIGETIPMRLSNFWILDTLQQKRTSKRSHLP